MSYLFKKKKFLLNSLKKKKKINLIIPKKSKKLKTPLKFFKKKKVSSRYILLKLINLITQKGKKTKSTNIILNSLL
jgi:hypothetical protein